MDSDSDFCENYLLSDEDSETEDEEELNELKKELEELKKDATVPS